MQQFDTTRTGTSTMTWDPWIYQDTSWSKLDFAGYHVEALDGEIGTIDRATNEVGRDYLVVDTGPWIFGQKVMLPAGVVQRIDTDKERVFVNRTKEQIKNAPLVDENSHREEAYRMRVGGYYGQTGAGWRPPV